MCYVFTRILAAALERERLDDRFEYDWCYLWDERLVRELEALAEEYRQLREQYRERYTALMRRAVRLPPEDFERMKAGAADAGIAGL